MVKHRQAEVGDSEWLEAHEEALPRTIGGQQWTMHGPSWAGYRKTADPKIPVLWSLAETSWVPGLGMGALRGWDRSDRRSRLGHLHVRLLGSS
jgi:hypothetical protein